MQICTVEHIYADLRRIYAGFRTHICRIQANTHSFECIETLFWHIYLIFAQNEFVAVIRSPTKALFSSDKEHTREHMQLVTECQALKRENYALNELLDAYEQGLSEIMTKIRTFMVNTQ